MKTKFFPAISVLAAACIAASAPLVAVNSAHAYGAESWRTAQAMSGQDQANPPAPFKWQDQVPAVVLGESFSFDPIDRDVAPNATWSVVRGQLPVGLHIDPSVGIEGIPQDGGDYVLTIEVHDGGQTYTPEFTFRVTMPWKPQSQVPEAVIGSAFEFDPVDRAISPSASWRLANGNLPLGMHVTSYGTIAGTPVASGHYTFEVAPSGGAQVQQLNIYVGRGRFVEKPVMSEWARYRTLSIPGFRCPPEAPYLSSAEPSVGEGLRYSSDIRGTRMILSHKYLPVQLRAFVRLRSNLQIVSTARGEVITGWEGDPNEAWVQYASADELGFTMWATCTNDLSAASFK